MDVQRITSTSLNSVAKKEEIAKESVSFTSVIEQRRSEANLERMNKKMAEIEAQGEKLSDNQSVDNLRKYKKLVKEFLDDAVKNGLELKEQRGFSQRGSTKVYKLVKEVDKKLIDLTNDVLSKEDKGLNVLSLVGEIKGMLVNIYT